jgi:2,4-dienoyl-CoA reductase-like NADH-dependent reductase (Old Yellow Enzyme family)
MSKLFSPLALRDVTDWHITHYGQFAFGGAGLITTEATAVSPRGRVRPLDAGLWDDSQIGPWRRVTDLAQSARKTAAG